MAQTKQKTVTTESAAAPVVAFLDQATLGPLVTLRRPHTRHAWRAWAGTRPEQLPERLAGVTIAVTNKVRIGARELDRLPELAGIAVAATGTDIIDLRACAERGVVVCNIRDYAGTSVAEHVIATLLALRRNLRGYQQDINTGAWQASGQFCFFREPVRDLAGSTLGIVGTGAIARAVARLAGGLGMRILFHARTPRAISGVETVSFERLLAEADVVSCHCALTPETTRLFDAEAFRRMRPGSILVNTARGAVVDLEALDRALDSGLLAGAAIDVAPVEPPPADAAIMQLARRRNVIVTPHSAWASVEGRQALADQLTDVVDGLLRGEARNAVTP